MCRARVWVEIPARTTNEPRWLVIGRIDGKHWPVVVTYREGRSRIISDRERCTCNDKIVVRIAVRSAHYHFQTTPRDLVSMEFIAAIEDMG